MHRLCLLGLMILGGCASSHRAGLPDSRQGPPNIIFVLADDLGWSELGCYGNRFHETPHLDRLATQGVRFTQAYAAAPVCSPYRAALLTGQVPARVGILDYLRPDGGHLSTDHVTLAETLKQKGYATGHIGKWHLTGYKHHGAAEEVRPTGHGFDSERMAEVKGVGNGANFYPYRFRTQPITWINAGKKRLLGNEYLTDRMNLEAVEFIERHRDQPFFLYLSHFAPHSILNGRPDLVDKYRKKHKPGPSERTRCYLCQDAGHEGDPLNHWAKHHNPHLAAMLESIDDGVGQIMKKLDALGLADNTIVVFTSDNGGESKVTPNGHLRGGKSMLYEAGVRVPLIVRWPAGGVTAGKVVDAQTSNIDFYPTFAEAAGARVDSKQHLDGVSILPALRGHSDWKRGPLFWHYPLTKKHFLGGVSAGAVRDGDWKLIEFFDDGRSELYNLALDPSEKTNLAGRHPDRLKALRRQLRAWRSTVGATIPAGQKQPG